MIETGCRLCFLQEAPAPLRVARFRARQHLDGYRAVQARVQGFVDLTHAARAQLIEQLILLNCSPYHTAAGKLTVCHSWRRVGRRSWILPERSVNDCGRPCVPL